MGRIEAVILDWAGTVVDYGSLAPTSIFVEGFKQAFDFDISLAEARAPRAMDGVEECHRPGCHRRGPLHQSR